MGILAMQDIRAGMTLAADVHGRNGRRLLPKGTVLTAEHLRVMHIWGVADADIVGQPPQASESIPLGLLAVATNLADGLFAVAGTTHPALAELYRLTVPDLATRLAAGWAPPEAPAEAPPAPTGPLPASPQDLLSRVRDLPALPDVYFQIRDLLEDRTSPLKLLAEVIGRDPGLSATLLKLVNSPLYGFPSRIDTLSRGITLVGTRELSKLAMGVTVIRMFQGVPEGLFTLRRFWEHSIACAVLSRIIDAQTGGDDLERSFLAGLLHDVGRLVMLLALPEVMAHVLHRANVEERLVCDLERETLGWDHGDMALVLLRSWKLPDSLVLSLACHHGLGATGPGPMRRAAGIINLADVVSAALGYATWELSPVPRLDPQGWDSLGLRPTQLAAIIAPARRQIRDVIASLLD